MGDTNDLVDSDITKRGVGDFRWDSKNWERRLINRQTRIDLDRLPLTLLSDATNTRVFTVQTSHKGDGIAVKVCLVVKGTLREDGSLTRGEDVGDEPVAIFLDETDFNA